MHLRQTDGRYPGATSKRNTALSGKELSDKKREISLKSANIWKTYDVVFIQTVV